MKKRIYLGKKDTGNLNLKFVNFKKRLFARRSWWIKVKINSFDKSSGHSIWRSNQSTCSSNWDEKSNSGHSRMIVDIIAEKDLNGQLTPISRPKKVVTVTIPIIRDIINVKELYGKLTLVIQIKETISIIIAIILSQPLNGILIFLLLSQI